MLPTLAVEAIEWVTTDIDPTASEFQFFVCLFFVYDMTSPLCSYYTEWKQWARYTTYILQTAATCFGYLDAAIFRLYTEL